ncbi:MAG: hypothetical protein K5790_02475 [Nitrosopumilus sp.]|uniref:hypothetical protein n=1 Tax=Nitrosopumilus sp. TaxID=2024843 RepID=UPI00247BC64E|nr:hypothetical protein [Nitrosopumilus sp.]MCV0392141.1 hypothetical protein [Nitrosopumilus sp.]
MTFHKYLGDSKMFEYDKHYRECQQLNKPFIKAKIDPRHGNYFVQIDLMTCDYDFSEKEIDTIQKLVDAESLFLKSKSNSIMHGYHIDKEIAWFDGISTENVHEFCEKLYDITQENHP